MTTRNSITAEEILRSGQNPADALKNFKTRIYPSKVRVDLNDKLTKFVFSLSESGIKDLLAGETFSIVEKKNFKKHGDIVTPYRILNAAGCTDQRPFNEFDRAVLSVCISELEVGNRYTTIPIIYRGLTGKVNRGSDAKPGKDQIAAILDSLQLLMGRTIQFNAAEVCERLGYNDGKPLKAKDLLLPARLIESATINGNVATVIFFDRECPLMKLAKAKKQIISYDTRLLDVPHQQNTRMNIALKNYVLRRVLEIIAHNLTPSLTFSDIFTRCRIENANLKVKNDARESILELCEYIKKEKVVRAFKFDKRENSLYSIVIDHSQKETK